MDFARKRLAGRPAEFIAGDALALPFAADSFDVAAMALVIFFMPDPALAVREMARVVRPGGRVASYSWDILGGGTPNDPFKIQFNAMGLSLPLPPHPEAAGLDALRALWSQAGLVEIETCEIAVQRDFESFDLYWDIHERGPLRQAFQSLSSEQLVELKSRLRDSLVLGPSGEVKCSGRATAVKGRRPA